MITSNDISDLTIESNPPTKRSLGLATPTIPVGLHTIISLAGSRPYSLVIVMQIYYEPCSQLSVSSLSLLLLLTYNFTRIYAPTQISLQCLFRPKNIEVV